MASLFQSMLLFLVYTIILTNNQIAANDNSAVSKDIVNAFISLSQYFSASFSTSASSISFVNIIHATRHTDWYIKDDGKRYKYGAVINAIFIAADFATLSSIPAFVRIDLSLQIL